MIMIKKYYDSDNSDYMTTITIRINIIIVTISQRN